MTIKQILDIFRTTIKEFTDDSIYDDEYLWNIFKLGRNELIAQKYKHNNPQNYITICIKLDKSLSHECGCITQGCEVYKSAELPRYITNKIGSTLRVYDLNYNRGVDVDESNKEAMELDPIYNQSLLFSIVNRKLIVWNKNYSVVQVSAIWEDVTDLQDIQYCNNIDNNGNTNCINVYDTDIGLDDKFVSTAVRMAFDILFPSKNFREDNTQDTNSNIIE